MKKNMEILNDFKNMEMFRCEICKREFKNLMSLANHIRQAHKNEISREEYYIKYIGEKGKCPECGNDTTFKNLGCGYHKFCSHNCAGKSIEIQNKKKETCMKNSGYTHPMKDPENKKKVKQTNFEKTGYEYSMQNPETKEKSKHTCFEKTGYKNPMQNPENKEKVLESTLKNNNGEHPLKLTYKKLKERYPLLVQVEELIEGPNGEIWGHCKNSNCKNSKENGGYFEPTINQLGWRKQGIDKNDTYYFYCCEDCKKACPLFGRSGVELHNLLNENKEILYTAGEYSTWRTEIFARQLLESSEHTINYCEYCGTTEDLHAHHIRPQKLEPGFVLDPDNGMVVCEKCHYEKCHEKGTDCSFGNLANKICK